jgi:NAD+ synthase
VNPIGELYKTEVRRLARHLGLPDTIVTKPPSADLWEDQTDEGEIGVTYDEIDAILHEIVDQGTTSRTSLQEKGFRREAVERVVTLLNHNWFKREMPPVAPLGRAAVPRQVELT